jgi:abequosyltransferase
MSRPVLTISIPTYKRAPYLSILLAQLLKELDKLDRRDQVEVLVSDNCSPDDTGEVVQHMMGCGLPVRYILNSENIGSDHNIAQCFNEARGRYVLIMGDDDVLVDGMLAALVEQLGQSSPGVVLLRAYGYDADFRSESPGTEGSWVSYDSADDFLLRASAQISLISACVINKQLLEPLDANRFVGGNLVQVHLVLKALLQARTGMSYEGYAVACKRNNSGGYAFSQVFVLELGRILDLYQAEGLSLETIQRYESRLLRAFHPYYVWRQLRFAPGDLALSQQHFEARFGGRWEYEVLIRPIYCLPRPAAWLWGAIVAALGRASGGELRRGLHFLYHTGVRFLRGTKVAR